jgi:hypothetical protein
MKLSPTPVEEACDGLEKHCRIIAFVHLVPRTFGHCYDVLSETIKEMENSVEVSAVK